MTETAKKTDPKLWEKVKEEVTEGDKGGKPGQWSARKAQMAVQEYKHEGGGYEGKKSEDNQPRPVGRGGLGHEVRREERRHRRALPAQGGARGPHRRGV